MDKGQILAYFGEDTELTQEGIKKRFREIVGKKHDSRSNEKFDMAELVQMKTLALEFIASHDITADVEGILRTTSGIPLSELGKGLGPTKNGTSCSHCDGKGYEEDKIPDILEAKCPHCEGTGNKHVPCRDCKGTGQFELRSGRKVECRKCKGTGKFQLPRGKYGYSWCEWCWGTGTVVVKHLGTKTLYHVCIHCDGSGEEELLNPVFQKGALFAASMKRKKKKANG